MGKTPAQIAAQKKLEENNQATAGAGTATTPVTPAVPPTEETPKTTTTTPAEKPATPAKAKVGSTPVNKLADEMLEEQEKKVAKDKAEHPEKYQD